MAFLDPPAPLKLRRTKIIATIGPATRSPDIIEKMMLAGVNVFRLNMSHGTQNDHLSAYQAIRAGADKHHLPIGILADLCGPKIRVGELKDGQIELRDGEEVTVTTRDVVGYDGLIPSHYRHLAEDVQAGDRILLDDGLLELRVLSAEQADVRCEVVHGGVLKSRKGMNLPCVAVSAPALTNKDREDAAFALDLGVDFLALSFVRRAGDVQELRELVATRHADVGIIAKIEKPEALEEIDAIIQVADGIMVARGDLGVELDAEQVPLVQDRLLELAQVHNKPCIVATQMLESMIQNPRPTRAEVADVAHAVRTAADAVMLSGETAVGRFPLDAVRMMDRIARRSEAYLWEHGLFANTIKSRGDGRLPLADSVARATSLLSRDLRVRAIVVVCHSGLSVAIVSSARPAAPIIALSDSGKTCTRMTLLWGVLPDRVEDVEISPAVAVDLPAVARQLARKYELGDAGEHILLVEGYHPEPERNVPSISVVELL
ncbi:MAG: pyruvate kinase [Gammaproteobacteria bacterium]|nr:pyruvate kinase [Gammaproteobacteria bacterium]MCP5138069.1 pyruvate kinase [Gammaproteobacteria bacterium]